MGDGRVGTGFCYVYIAYSRIRKLGKVNGVTYKRVAVVGRVIS